ncbi:MAG: response regulator transcription factor [Bacteroidales bacterium]|nr:response regulator transcription factor [Bacteroidales bacterium]
MKDRYYSEDKMHELLADSERLLQVVSRFSIPLGVGDKTIEQVCRENHIDTATFLVIVNFTHSGGDYSYPHDTKIDLQTLKKYLQNTHIYLLKFLLPHIRRHLIDALGSSLNNDITFLIIKFFDEYYKELENHMNVEDKEIFMRLDELQKGKKIKKLSSEISRIHTAPIEQKLSELKNIIIKYYTSESDNNMIYNILQHLFICEYDLYIHDRIENLLLIPEIKKLEQQNERNSASSNAEDENTDNNGELTEREKEIITGVVKGLTNKEIADKLFISVNTVTTHRRNIARKLNIHSPAGLTIYAIMNNFVDIKEIKL